MKKLFISILFLYFFSQLSIYSRQPLPAHFCITISIRLILGNLSLFLTSLPFSVSVDILSRFPHLP